MKDVKSLEDGYEKAWLIRLGKNEERSAYDLGRLLDSAWSLKVFSESLSERRHGLWKITEHDIFRMVMLSAGHVNNAIVSLKIDIDPSSWAFFIKLLNDLHRNRTQLDNELVLSFVCLIFISALIFKAPSGGVISNIVSDSGASRNGMFPASSRDIEFAKSLSGNLDGSFITKKDISNKLEDNLCIYVGKLREARRNK